MSAFDASPSDLLRENAELRALLDEAEETLRAIRTGEVDALVVSGPAGERVFTLAGAEQPYRALVEAMNEGAATLDADGTILYGNRCLATWLQVPLQNLIGTSLARFVAPDDRPAFLDLLAHGKTDDARGEVALRGGDGEAPLALHLSFSPFDVQGVSGVSLVATDLTLRKQAENLLRRAHVILEERVQERTAELTQANATLQKEVAVRQRAEEALLQANQLAQELTLQAQEASEAKGQFLANMSHEIRTPMNAIVGLTEMLAKTILDERQREYARLMRLSADSMLNVIGDILDFSKIEAGKIEFESVPFDPFAFAQDVADVLGFEAKHKGLRLLSSPGPTSPVLLMGDPGRFRQVLYNLVGNAVKFTPEGGEVNVALAVDGLPGGHALLSVRVTDTGIGIPPDQVDRLFQPFRQADASTTRRHGGSGLGLIICKRLVEMMGGGIGMESTPGRGSCFHFHVPLARAAGDAVGAQPASSAAAPGLADASRALATCGRRLRILLAEDNEIGRLVVENMFEGLPVDVTSVGTGVQAARQATDGDFDLALMDIQMPEMDGYDATAAIRAHEAQSGRRRLPIVALTAHASAGDALRCHQAGMDDYLTKPVLPAALLAAVVRWAVEKGGE